MNGNTSGLAHGTPGTQQSFEQMEIEKIVAINESIAKGEMPNFQSAITPIEKFNN